MFLKREKIKVYLLPAANKALSFFGMDDSKRLSTSLSPRTRAPSKGTQVSIHQIYSCSWPATTGDFKVENIGCYWFKIGCRRQ